MASWASCSWSRSSRISSACQQCPSDKRQSMYQQNAERRRRHSLLQCLLLKPVTCICPCKMSTGTAKGRCMKHCKHWQSPGLGLTGPLLAPATPVPAAHSQLPAPADTKMSADTKAVRDLGQFMTIGMHLCKSLPPWQIAFGRFPGQPLHEEYETQAGTYGYRALFRSTCIACRC